MSTKSVGMANSHCVVPILLLCAVCVAASFSSLLYAITAIGDIEALNARLVALESRGGCDTREPLLATTRTGRPLEESDGHRSQLPANVVPGRESGVKETYVLGFLSNRSSESTGEHAAQKDPIIDDTVSSASHLKSSSSRWEPFAVIHPALVFHQMVERRRRSASPSSSQIINSEVTDEGTHVVERQAGNQSVIREQHKRSSPQNREFLNEEDVEDFSREDRRRRGRRRGGGREEAVMRGGPRMTGGQQILAVHFDGDASKYSLGHRHYEGNGRLRHPDGIFRDWRLRDWSGRYERQFHIQENDGTLTIREPGIYFVYAQVYYLDDHDINGFRVLVNESPVLQCTVMTHGGALTKANTCFTGGLVDLQAGDTILLRDLAALRYSIFEPGKSFFGLFRITHHSMVTREGP